MDKIMEQIVAALKPMLEGFKSQIIAELSARMDAGFDDIEKDAANTKDVLGDVAANVRVLMHDMAEVKGTLLEVRERSGRHAEILLDHDQRLRRLEEHRA